jgi:hypothetical protein
LCLWPELLHEERGIEQGLAMPLENESSEMTAIFTTMINQTKDATRQRIQSRNEKLLSSIFAISSLV